MVRCSRAALEEGPTGGVGSQVRGPVVGLPDRNKCRGEVWDGGGVRRGARGGPVPKVLGGQESHK